MENTDFMFDLPKNKSSKIKVIGVGGAGGNAVSYMYKLGIENIDFVVCNTDAQALSGSSIPNKIQLGASITEGLGAGANPDIGERSAIETLEKIKDLLENNTKMVFITAGMGGGTGTGAAPIIAKCARDMGILTVGIVTMPFAFEGEIRQIHAEKGIERLRNNVDSLIVINNNKLRELYGNLGYKAGFTKSDEILANAAKGIAQIITQNYQVNIDLMDVKKVLSDSGTALMGSALAKGENKAMEAITKAMDSPLLNDNKITDAKNVLLLIVSGKEEITIDEIGVINDHIQKEAGNNAHIIMGIGEDPSLEDNISVMLVATGFTHDDHPKFNAEKIVKHSLNEMKIEDDFGLKKSTPASPPKAIISTTNSSKIIRHELIDEQENTTPALEEEEIKLVKKDSSEISSMSSFSFELDLPKRNEIPKEEKEHSQTTIFRLEDIEDDEPADEKKNEPFVADSIQELIDQRRKKLKEFNSLYKKFQILPTTPAYSRNFSENELSAEKGKSSLYLDPQNNHLKPNSFLHDNVD